MRQKRQGTMKHSQINPSNHSKMHIELAERKKVLTINSTKHDHSAITDIISPKS